MMIINHSAPAIIKNPPILNSFIMTLTHIKYKNTPPRPPYHLRLRYIQRKKLLQFIHLINDNNE